MAEHPDPLRVRFEGVDTSIVSDALDEHGIDGVIGGLDPAHPDHAAVGRARPIEFEWVESREATNFPYAMLEAIAPGEVFVIDGVSEHVSCWGGLASRLAAEGGLAGVVIDGGFRDAPDVRAGSFPVFAAGSTPRTGQRRVRIASTDEPVEVDGVEVAPGDVVVADATGVVVVPAGSAPGVADTVEGMAEAERAIEERIAHGASVADLREGGFEF